MNYILTTNNHSKYPTLQLYTPANGINFVDGTYKNMITLYYNDTITGTQYHKSQGTKLSCTAMVFHAHGTITRNDITDGTTFYYFVDDGPAMDNVSFIPCNTEDCVTHVDEWYFRTNISNSGFWNVYINVFPCNNNYKTISITFTVNLQVDCYCM